VDWSEPIYVGGPIPSATQFAGGYDATEDKGKRRAIAPNHRSEDAVLTPQKRSVLLANARDLCRNFVLTMWMIRRHLDYVATFQFHARTPDSKANTAIEKFMTRWFKPMNCDASGRHFFSRLVRLLEARTVIDGDIGILKVKGGYLQLIESDRIRNPMDGIDESWIHGVKTVNPGRAVAYCLHKRVGNGWEQERIVSATDIIQHSYYERYDQTRGISPIVSGLNQMRDVYEGFEYGLAKQKVQQLFAMAVYRNATEGMGNSDDATDGGEEAQSVLGRYKVNFGNGPVFLDMEPGDRAEFLKGTGDGGDLVEFLTAIMQLAMKMLDIPYSFYDESHTNFFGSKAAWMHYERTSNSKREALANILDRITIWRLFLAITNKEIPDLPKSLSVADLDWEWVPTGMPWWDPAKEINGNLMAIAAGLDTPQRICKENGKGDFEDNIDQIAKAVEYAKSKGVELSFAPQPMPAEITVNNGK